MEVVLADEATVAHVHQAAQNGGLAVAAGHREQALVRRAVAAGEHGLGFVDGHTQQLVFVRHDEVALQQIAQAARLDRAGAHLGHGRGGEALGQERQQVFAGGRLGVLGRAARDVGQATRARDQAHAHFHQSHVAFHVRHPARAVHRQLAATAQRQAAHGADHRHVGVAQAQHHLLHKAFGVFHRGHTDRHEGGQQGLQVGTGAEGLVARPDHQALVLALGQVHRRHQAFADLGAQGVHLGLDAGDQHLTVEGPGAQVGVFADGGAGGAEIGPRFAEQQLGEMLALVHRQAAAWLKHAFARVPRTLGGVHPTGVRHRTLEHPGGQRRFAQRLAGVDVFLHHLRHFKPAGFLPQLKRALLHAKAPAHGQVHVARGLGNVRQMHRSVMKAVAQDGPEELALGPFAVAQQFQALGGGFLEHAAIHLVGLLAGRHIVFAGQVKTHDVAPDLFEETGFGLLAQVTHLDQGLQHLGGAEVAVERVGVGVQVVLQRLDDVGHGVQAHHIGGAERAAAGAAQALAGQVVHHVVGEAEVLDLFHGGQHAGNADAVGHKVGCVLGTHHTLAERAGGKGFQVVKDGGLGGRGGDQFHQRHVARRVEEVDAAEARPQLLGQRVGQRGDRQARGVGREDGVGRNKGCDLGVEVALPVHALSDGFDDQVAIAQLFEVFFVIGLTDQVGVRRHAQRRGLELFEVVDGALDDAVFVRGFAVGQIEQHHRHLHVDQMGRDLRPHHTRAQHGHFFHKESVHRNSFKASAAKAPTWRPCPRASQTQHKARPRWSEVPEVQAPVGPAPPAHWERPLEGVARSAAGVGQITPPVATPECDRTGQGSRGLAMSCHRLGAQCAPCTPCRCSGP